ncbi:hypothetical protein [Desulfovibrio oxyclinae]|jgi:hypothetical protein|uniref:hypothetical protein n=1 Tax=Desulfovibrio oxyclinae TaxID=63560 RepID=UPI000375F9F9|nr:hypothetical protein [Desulfovibrio oxyclinae]
MLVIDGQKYDLGNHNMDNLEQVFTKVVEEGRLDDRVVTDVYLNEEPFSEIYPNQSEDIELSEVQSIEIKTVPFDTMAVEITRELYKVVNIMAKGAEGVSDLFRRADDAEALESYQDLLDVTRHFLNMVSMLRDEYSLKENPEYNGASELMSELFTEMSDVLENEDWILLADLLEYDFLPAVEKWKKVIANLREDIRRTKG